jgi:hypothetical protein
VGREFVFVAVRSTWSERRVFFLDEDGTQRSLPAAWTDAAAPDPFVALARGRSALRMEDLLALAQLVDAVRGARPRRRSVRRILP